MYSTSHPVSSSMNGMGAGMIDDGSGTINPAALSGGASVLPTPASTSSPRGLKRSRSPEGYQEPLGGSAEDEEARRRKRGRLTKSRLSGIETEQLPAVQTTPQQQQNNQAPPQQVRTPRSQTQPLPQQQQQQQQQSQSQQVTPTQTSPSKATPTKSVVKALPTVRDHTTDQLSPEGDEYIPREYDEAGEKKVSPTGRALEGREYKCRTFLVPNRGDKLFMLATECARVLGYRDSYLLFNKNRSLFKIIATQPEKDDLIAQEILPYSYRSRQIAIVTAKSMFRQFGSRVVVDGRRVRDDYWEAKARKQGFTEEDLAGEKRPGGAKAAREAQAAEAANAAALGHHQDVVYSNGPGTIPVDAHGHPQLMQAGMGGHMGSIAPLPMISLAPSEDMRLREYINIPRPRQEITGAPYQDRTQPSSMSEIMNQATHTAEFSKILNQQQRSRGKQLDEFWKQPREVPVSSPLQQTNEAGATLAQTVQSPQVAPGSSVSSSHQQPMLQQHQGAQMMAPQGYQQTPHHQQNPSHSPASRSMQQQMRPEQVQQHRPSSLAYGSGGPQSSYYGQSPQMWGHPPPQPQPQQSPISSHHGLPQYSPQAAHPSQSPHSSHSPHPHNAQQQAQQQQQAQAQAQQQQASHQPQPQPPHLQHSQSSGSMHGAMGYQGMGGMSQGYPGMAGRPMYQQQQQSPGSHGYMQQTTAGGGASLQGWAPPPPQPGHGGQQGWQGGY